MAKSVWFSDVAMSLISVTDHPSIRMLQINYKWFSCKDQHLRCSRWSLLSYYLITDAQISPFPHHASHSWGWGLGRIHVPLLLSCLVTESVVLHSDTKQEIKWQSVVSDALRHHVSVRLHWDHFNAKRKNIMQYHPVTQDNTCDKVQHIFSSLVSFYST